MINAGIRPNRIVYAYLRRPQKILIWLVINPKSYRLFSALLFINGAVVFHLKITSEQF
jgi:hypothetical protein